ncbi:MAG: hypothetical protein AB1401_04200 [Thermodesulfobacteriota bacterium]
MEKEKDLIENSSADKGQDGIFSKPKINELDSDWDDYLEGILYYGIESWRGG